MSRPANALRRSKQILCSPQQRSGVGTTPLFVCSHDQGRSFSCLDFARNRHALH
jgi:hypothetical protein